MRISIRVETTDFSFMDPKTNQLTFQILFTHLNNLKFFCGKKDAFDCAGIRTPDNVGINKHFKLN